MREIKFRAWDKENNKMEKVLKHEMGANNFWVTLYNRDFSRIVVNSNCLVMQYTGLKDKNGKEIYEGDIISNNGTNRIVVKYTNGGFSPLCFMIPSEICLSTVVVGNVYENSELLESL